MTSWLPDSTFAVLSITDWKFWVFGVYFLLAFVLSFVTPGLVLLHKTKLRQTSFWLLAPVIGIAFWGIQGFFFGHLDQILSTRWLSYAYLAFFNFLFLKLFFKKFTLFFKNNQNISKIVARAARIMPPFGWMILGLGSFLQWLAVMSSGLMTPDGVVFYWLNGFDGVLHISFIRSLIASFPPLQPGAWPLQITNYHYWSDLIMADLGRVWGLPIMHQYFQHFPLILAPLLGLLSYQLIKTWTRSKAAGLWALFLYFFAGDMMYVFLLLWHGTWGEHTLTIDNGIIQFLNMPQAFAKLIVLGGLLLFHHWQTKKNDWSGWLAVILFATAVGFKVYFGMLAALGMVCFSLVQGIQKLREKSPITVFKKIKTIFLDSGLKIILMASLAATIFFPVNRAAGGLFWAPLEWPKLLLGFGKLDWHEWWLRLQVYEANHNTKALFAWYGLATVIFLVAGYGTRLLGLLFPRKVSKAIGWHNFWFLYPSILIFTFIGMNFLQDSGLHNVFNFFVVSLFALSLLTPVVLIEISKKMKTSFLQPFALIFASIFVLLNLPRIIETTRFYISSQIKGFEKSVVSSGELEALTFLSETETTLIQTHPKNLLDDYAPYPYIFTEKYAYFGGRGVLKSHNQPISDRKELVELLFFTSGTSEARELMEKAGISHLIYQKKYKDQAPRFLFDGKHGGIMKSAFENEDILILTYGNDQTY